MSLNADKQSLPAKKSRPARYNSLAIFLHWLMALGVLLMLTSGLTMVYGDLSKSLQFQMYQWHKAGGVLMLLALLLRLGWRLSTSVPALPSRFRRWEQIAAKFGHWGLYLLLLCMPLSGWVMVSASPFGLPTMVFDLFKWPHLPGLQGDKEIEALAKTAHLVFAILLGLLLAAHIGAVIKHARADGENLLRRIWWMRGKKSSKP